MLEEPKIKKVDKRDKQLPQNFEQLIEMYDVEKIWPYIKRTIEYVNNDLDKIRVSPTEPINDEKVWIQHSKNLFNKEDYFLDYQGHVGFNLRLELGKTYTLSSNKPLYIAKFAEYASQADGSEGPQIWKSFTSWTFVAGNDTNNHLNNKVFLGLVSSNGDAISKNIDDFKDYEIQIEEGSVATEYEPYIDNNKIYTKNKDGNYEVFMEEEVVISPTEPGIHRGKVWIQKSKNLFDGKIASGLINSTDNGNIGPSSYTVVGVNYIPVKSRTSYVVSAKYDTLSNSNVRDIGIYDKNKSFIKVVSWNNSLTVITPEYDGFIRIGYDKNCYDVMVEQGSKATEYEEYIEQKIWCKNENGKYEEFVNMERASNQQNYSTDEQVIGTWINGKPLYRKVVTTTAPEVTTDGTYPTNLSKGFATNVDFAIIKEAYVNVNNEWFTLPYILNGNGIIKAFINILSSGVVDLVIATNSTYFSKKTVTAIVEYTKTTD